MASRFFPELLRSHTRQALEGFLQTDANLKRPGTVPGNRTERIVKQIAIDESGYVNVSIVNFSPARITIFRPNRQDTHEAADDVDRRPGIVDPGRQGARCDFGKNNQTEAGIVLERTRLPNQKRLRQFTALMFVRLPSNKSQGLIRLGERPRQTLDINRPAHLFGDTRQGFYIKILDISELAAVQRNGGGWDSLQILTVEAWMQPSRSHCVRGRFLDLFDCLAEAANPREIIDPPEKGDDNQRHDDKRHKEQYRAAARSIKMCVQRDDPH